MAVNVLIDGLTADMQVYRAGRVENPGPQLLEIARERRMWGDRLMAEIIDDPPSGDVADYYEIEWQNDEPASYKCKLCGYTTTQKFRMTGHINMKHRGRGKGAGSDS